MVGRALLERRTMGKGWKVCPVILDNSIKPSPAGHLRASVSDRLKWTLFEGRGWLLSVAKTKQQKKVKSDTEGIDRARLVIGFIHLVVLD